MFYDDDDDRKKVLYEVECPHHAEGEKPHVFNRMFKLEEGSDEVTETEVQARCAICDKMVTVTIKGKPKLDEWVKRYAEEQDAYFEKRRLEKEGKSQD